MGSGLLDLWPHAHSFFCYFIFDMYSQYHLDGALSTSSVTF
ncbi:hypothetical protein NITLEN_40049 [Nitrospira lenta]|uniref:Uncharacterized protein n=1 Tax=Nitrospira lenta TaxID=1436998 RepID=A0A330L780_9BACT|nr:hypothetical protein NITLEN_40049 [Nitrospira lenta]